MDTLMQILDKQYEESREMAEKYLSLIDYHLQYASPPLVAVITKYQEELDDGIRGMVAVRFAKMEADK